ncbi:hypothetical protein D3C76_1242450 [compost metagenome]
MPRLGKPGDIGRVITVQGQGDHELALGLARLGGLEVDRIHADILAGVRLDVQLHEHAHARVTVDPLWPVAGLPDNGQVLPGEYIRQWNVTFGTLAVFMLLDVDEENLVARLDAVFREVDDDVIAFGNALYRQNGIVVLSVAVAIEVQAAIERHRVLHDIAVVGNHVERHPVV